MRKYLILLLLFPFVFSAQKNDTLYKLNEKNTKEIVELNQKLVKLQETLDRERNISDKSFNGISNQLSASSNSLTIFSILFGVLALIIGFYVTYIERKIVRIREENMELLSQAQSVKKEVVEINREIQSDIEGLFKKIKKEETNHILDRLINVPKDVANLLDGLLSRELSKTDFDKLKVSYEKLDPIDITYMEKYEMLFFQHFSDLSLKDLMIKERFIKYIPTGINYSFDNDILKSSKDIFNFIVDTGLVNNKEIINVYFGGLENSKFKEFKILYELIFQILSQRDKQFLLYQLIEKDNYAESVKINYGNLLDTNYSSNSLTQSEKLVFENLIEIKQLKTEREEKLKLEKELEEKRIKDEEAKNNGSA